MMNIGVVPTVLSTIINMLACNIHCDLEVFWSRQGMSKYVAITC